MILYKIHHGNIIFNFLLPLGGEEGGSCAGGNYAGYGDPLKTAEHFAEKYQT